MTQSVFKEQTPKTLIQDLFEESSTQKQRMGSTVLLADGREFVYGQAGAANIAVGKLVQGAVHDVANHGNMAVANANANATALTVTLGDLLVTANMYAEGFLHISDGTGEGYAYKIKSHPAAVANANVVITLYDKLRLTLATAFCTLCKHPASGVVIMPSPPTQALVGSTIIPVTANYYAWFQKRGPACVLANGTLVAGDRAYTSTAVDGAVSPSSGNAVDMAVEQFVGHVLTVNANTHHALINLVIA